MADPLFDTLFRSTVRPAQPPAIASAAPVREAGTHSRAGNAMSRTRAALLEGARRAVEVGGTKITMAQVAAAAGVAKATLYNHFRTRDDVYAAVLVAQVDEIAAAASEREDFVGALAEAARLVAQHPALRKVVAEDPAILVGLLSVHGAELSAAARAHVSEALQRSGCSTTQAAVGLVASFLASQIFTPTDAAERGAIAELICAAALRDSSTQAVPRGQ